jgi:redox-sensitive bicupin YhaK (pirin superfamily)
MLQLRASSSLDGGDYGWLKARHHFAVTSEGNRANGALGGLVVWNDDEIAAGTGFGLHPHVNMEIVSYVREGTVTHRDNLGNVGRTAAGEVQAMSAGTGIRHAEHNFGAQPLKLFQIWIRPRSRGGTPQWATRKFPEADRANELVVLASGVPGDDALPLRADARVLGATLRAGARIDHELRHFRNAYVAPARGLLEVNGVRVAVGDGIAATDERRLTLVAQQDSELVLVEAA